MKCRLDTLAVREDCNPAEVVASGPGRAVLVEGFDSMLQRISNSRLFNLLSGIIPAVFFFLLVRTEANRLFIILNRSELAGTEAQFYSYVTLSFSKILFMSLIIALFVFRRQPVRKSEGIMPRLTAIAGSFLMFLLVLCPAQPPSMLQSGIGMLLVIVGSVFSIVSVATLGRSFSIMAEARRLVTHGVYSIVRHPLYLAEEIAVLGIVVQVFSLPAVLLLAFHLAIQVQRMGNEEAVLMKAFPEYETYMVHTSRLIPGVY